jgi:hypothetical protein
MQGINYTLLGASLLNKIYFAGFNFCNVSYKLSLLHVMPMPAMVWNSVHKAATANCFRKAGFITNAIPAEEEEDHNDEVSCDAWSSLKEKLNIRSTFVEFVQADDALTSYRMLNFN